MLTMIPYIEGLVENYFNYLVLYNKLKSRAWCKTIL